MGKRANQHCHVSQTAVVLHRGKFLNPSIQGQVKNKQLCFYVLRIKSKCDFEINML